MSILPESLSSLDLKYLEETKLRDLFDSYDTDSNGAIDLQEATRLLKDANANNDAATSETDLEAGAQKIIDSMDVNKNNQVEWNEFKEAVDRAAAPVSPRIYPISGSLLLKYTGMGVTWPILPILARSAGFSTSELGMVNAAGSLAGLVSNVPATLSAERFGRRPMLIIGPAVSAVGMLGYALTDPSFTNFAIAGSLGGIGGAMTVAAANLYLADISTPLNRSQTMAPLQLTALAGFAVGPALGGFVAEAYGLQAPFLVTAGGFFAAAAAAMAFLPETMRKKKKQNASQSKTMQEGACDDSVKEDGSQSTTSATMTTFTTTLGQWKTLLIKPEIQAINSASFIAGFGQGAAPVSFTIYATENLGMQPSELGLMFAAGMVCMAVVAQPAANFADRYQTKGCRSNLIIPGLALPALLVAIQGMELFPSALPYAALFTGRMVINAALVMPNITPFLMDSANEEERAQAIVSILSLERTQKDEIDEFSPRFTHSRTHIFSNSHTLLATTIYNFWACINNK